MSKRAADTLRKHRRILRDVLRRLNQGDVDDATYLLEQDIEALECDALAELQNGKAWWAEQTSKIQHRPRVDGEIQIPPEQEKWFGQAYPGQELSAEQFDELDEDDREDETRGG